MEQEDWLIGQKNYHHNLREELFANKKKKKTSSTSKILKTLVDAPCNTRKIRKYLNNEKFKHKKRIHHPSLT